MNHLALDLGAVAQNDAPPALPLTPNEARITQEIFDMFGTNAAPPAHPSHPVVFSSAEPINALVQPNVAITDFSNPAINAPPPATVVSAPLPLMTAVEQVPTPMSAPVPVPDTATMTTGLARPTAPISAPISVPAMPAARVQAPLPAAAPAPAPMAQTKPSQTTPVAKESRGGKDTSWGVALAKLNAHRSALESWAQEVREKRPAFGTTRDREERRKETNRKSAKVSRLRWRAYLVELEKVLVDGERNTQRLKREVVEIDHEQKQLEATLLRLRQQAQLRRQNMPDPVF